MSTRSIVWCINVFMSKIPLSALVILKYENELFFIVRQNHLRVFPGYCSFPGGKVDKREAGLRLGAIPEKLAGAADRELNEELRFNLKEEVAQGLVKSVKEIGRAVTPDFNPYRFEARYILVEVKTKPSFVLDQSEIREAFWATPAQMRERYHRGELIVIPPMWKILKHIESDYPEYGVFDCPVPEGHVPVLESIFGVKQFMPLSNTLPPAERTNAFLIGSLLADPSPKDESELEKLINSLPVNKIKTIFITHHHGDHHHLCRELAKALDAKIVMSRYTRERIERLGGKDYFKGLRLESASEGDVVAQWLGEKVIVYEVPGHDEGQLALAPESLRWFLAGDLFQGIGTVVVGGEEGDMAKYFQTLERVISLGPKAVYPSHGIVLGGTNILEKTLRHRQAREAQVLEMAKEGLSEEEMLKRIYFDLPPFLAKYALANICAHLAKLRDEGKI